MESKSRKILLNLAILVITLAMAGAVWAAPMGTAFTYQGRLSDANSPADDLYDFEFSLFDDAAAGIQKGGTVTEDDVDVTDGYFTVLLDFGDEPNAFTGDARWLEIAVRPGASTGSFTTLNPRKEITPTPYAMYASNTKVKQLITDFVVDSGESVNAGDVVTFLDGYVQKMDMPPDSPFGSGYEFNSDSYLISAAALSSTKFVVAYLDQDNSDYGTAVIGDVSGNTISYGSEYVFNSGLNDTSLLSAAALSSTKFVVAYEDAGNSNYGTAVIGDVSGNTISYGSECVFNSGDTPYNIAAALSSTKFVVTYTDAGNSNYGTAVIGNVSGNTISYGSEYVFNSASTGYISAAALSSTKFVVAYTDAGNSNYGTAVIGDVSGNTISYGSEYVFNSASTVYISAAALSSTKFVVAYDDSGGRAVIGDVSGNTITYGSTYTFNYEGTFFVSAAALSSTKFVVAYCNQEMVVRGRAVIGDVSGNTISYGSLSEFNSAPAYYISSVALSSTIFVVAYYDPAVYFAGLAVVGDARFWNPPGYVVGIAKESAAAGETVPVIIGGVSDAHSSLTPGTIYYADQYGDLTTTVTDWWIGLAISDTEILLATPFF